MAQDEGSAIDEPDQPSAPPVDVADGSAPAPSPDDAEVRDTLPDDLDVSGYMGQVTFPDNSQRRIPGFLYLAIAAVCVVVWAVAGDDAVLVNDGVLVAAVVLAAFGVYSISAGWPLGLDATDALVEATRQVGFPVGHASASLSWRGLRSRPTWRILLYSAEEPPRSRGLVLVDAVDGTVLQHFVEDNPEEWAQPGSGESADRQ
ncbi:MAG: hypothetical protein H0X58_08370 [Acidimicrobiia bacterium]|nr:hypothetical protein [Acidimicrobiia bacterium]